MSRSVGTDPKEQPIRRPRVVTFFNPQPTPKIIAIDVHLMITVESTQNRRQLIANMEMFEYLRKNFSRHDYFLLFSETGNKHQGIAFSISESKNSITISEIINTLDSIAKTPCVVNRKTEYLYGNIQFMWADYPLEQGIGNILERLKPQNEQITVFSANKALLDKISENLPGCNMLYGALLSRNIMQHDTEAALQFALTQLRKNPNEKITILLDYDDTLIDADKTDKMRKPIVIMTTVEKVAYLCKEIRKEFLKVNIQFRVISARATDDVIKETGVNNNHLLVENGLPLFFAELEKLTGEKFSVLPEDIYCLGKFKNGELHSPLKSEFLTNNPNNFASTNIFFDDSSTQLLALNRLSKMGILKLAVVRVTGKQQQTSAVSAKEALLLL